MSETTFIKTYQALIGDVTDMTKSWSSPLPKAFWVNTLKIKPEHFAEIVVKEQLDCKMVSWSDSAYIAGAGFSPSKHWAFSVGLIQMQEEVAMQSVRVLDLKPGEMVLDCCAAPGNKTAQMAIAMQNTGTVIANDINFSRMRAFGQINKRLGLVNVSSSIYNAANLPKMLECFDAVMVDVPCSCEGTFRKKWPKQISAVSEKSSRAQAKRQLAILNKAIRLTKPGGRLVYSTCTFSPYENEGVITAALAHWRDAIEIEAISLDPFKTVPGVTRWGNDLFAKSCEKTIRIWPHLNDTGGFYIALIRKKRSVYRQQQDMSLLPVDDMRDALDTHPLCERFGFDSCMFEPYALTQASTRGWSLVNKGHVLPRGLRVDASGLFFYKTSIAYPKVSTAAALVLGRFATKNRVVLDAAMRDQYLQAQDLIVDEKHLERVSDTGYVLVYYDDICLGVGLYFAPSEKTQSHRVRSLFSRSICAS